MLESVCIPGPTTFVNAILLFLVIYDYTGFFYDGSVGHVIFDKDVSEGV